MAESIAKEEATGTAQAATSSGTLATAEVLVVVGTSTTGESQANLPVRSPYISSFCTN
jgi:hypothetical protein